MWGRIVEIEVSGSSGVILSTDELRVDFYYMHIWGTADICTVQVFNLKPETFKSLTNDKALTIKLSAGYRDINGVLPVVLEGHINNVWGQKVPPNHITQLYCVPSALYTASGQTKTPTVPRGSTYESHIRAIATALEVTVVEFIGDKVKALVAQVMDARTVDTVIYTELMVIQKMLGIKIKLVAKQMTVIVDPGVVGAVEDAVSSSTSNVISLDTIFLRGSPKITASQVNIPYALSTQILCGDVIDMGVNSEEHSLASVADISGLGANLNRADGFADSVVARYYMVMKVEHTGSAYTKDWHSNITATYASNDTSGAVNNV